jgi:hypothetical protein
MHQSRESNSGSLFLVSERASFSVYLQKQRTQLLYSDKMVRYQEIRYTHGIYQKLVVSGRWKDVEAVY